MKLSEAQLTATRWLTENGAKHLACLIGSIVFHSSTPIVIADDSRRLVEASMGASKLLGLSRGDIIGRSLDEFMTLDAAPVISERWRTFLQEGEQQGTFSLLEPDGSAREVDYTAKLNVLPDRHLLVLTAPDAITPGKGTNSNGTCCAQETQPGSSPDTSAENGSHSFIPASVQDYALLLLDVNEEIASWYAGAEVCMVSRAIRSLAATFRCSTPMKISLVPIKNRRLRILPPMGISAPKTCK